MIERIYRCNLCRRQIYQEQFIELTWKGGHDTGHWEDGTTQPDRCENHICRRCLADMHKIAEQQPKPYGMAETT